MGFKNEFETAMVNEPSVFEPLKVYCIYIYFHLNLPSVLKIVYIVQMSLYLFKTIQKH